MNEILSGAVSVIVMDWSMRAVDWKLLKIWPTMTVQLSIQIGKDTALKKRVVGEVNASDNMARLKLW